MPTPDPRDPGNAFPGFHEFTQGTHPPGFGSFEVFYAPLSPEEQRGEPNEDVLPEGWYWWPCFPGCLPDGEPNGPFLTAEGAYLDAIQE